MVYLASSLALAVLETRVRLEVAVTQQPYVALEFALPAHLIDHPPALPENWRASQEITRSIGSRWVQGGSSLALEVPSAIIPGGTNYLLNPLHHEIAQVRPLQHLAFDWDERLF